MNDDEEEVLTIELEIVVPKNLDEASENGGQLGLMLFNKVIVAIRNILHDHGASGQDASNVVLNAQIVAYTYTMLTSIAAMEGSSMLPEDLQVKFAPILKEVMTFTADTFGRHAKKGLYSLRDRTGLRKDIGPPKEGP